MDSITPRQKLSPHNTQRIERFFILYIPAYHSDCLQHLEYSQKFSDILLFGDTVEECRKNVDITKRYLEKLGFVIHVKKSQFEPIKITTFWGNKINLERINDR